MKKKGLGTGLDALFGETTEENAGDGVRFLPIAKVEPRADQPREKFDEESLNELAESISAYGVIQPIAVRALDTGFYQIIAGERRWRAARLAGLAEVPVRILAADDRRATELALVENLQREDLNPIEEARGYRTLMEEYGLTQEETAKSVGKSRPAVANALRLLGLSPEVLKLVEEGVISAGHGRAVMSLGEPELQQKAAQKVLSLGLSVRQTEAFVARMGKDLKLPKGTAAPGITVDYAKEAAQELQHSLGRGVKIVEGRRKGRIELEYYDADDREALLSALAGIGKMWKK